MVKYKVEYERDKCIGAAECAALQPDRWEMNSDGKADLLKGEKNENLWVAYFEEEELEQFMEAAESCPVTVIHIINTETNERLI